MSLTDWPGSVPADVRLVPRDTSDPAVRVYLPSLDELARRWQTVEPLLQKATARTGCYEPVDLLAMAVAGQAGMWLCTYHDHIDAVLVTQLTTYPRRRVLEVMFGGGAGLKRWRNTAVAAVDRHARQLGCSHVMCCGRRGWVKAWGAKLTGDVIMVRDV